MQKRLVLLTTLVLSAVLSSPIYAASPKAGASCTKAGSSAIYAGKKYTCIKSGKKLVWDKGVVVPAPKPSTPPTTSPSPMPTPTATPTPTPSSVNSFVSGLFEENYDGYFEDIANFFLRESKSSQSANSINYQKGFDGKNEFSKQWKGYFLPNESGTWTFTLTSDDASYLWLGKSAYLKSISPSPQINLRGIHGPQTASTTLFLNKDNAYPLRIIYGNSINFAQITFSITSPSGRKFSDFTSLTRYFSSSTLKDSGFDLNLDSIKTGESSVPISTEIWKNSPRDSIALAIQEILDIAEKNTISYKGNVTWVFQGETSSDVESATKRGLLNGIDLFTKLGFNTTNAIVLNARDMDWLRSQLTQFGCSYRELPANPGFYVPRTCQGGNGANTAQHWEIAKTSEGLDGIEFNHVLSHEYFHQLQEELSGNVGNRVAPLWFWEGGAHFFTLLAFSSWNKERYYEQWSEHWFGEVWPDQKANCIPVDVFRLQNSESGPNRVCGYSKGSIIVEYLIASYGIQKYKSLISVVAQNPDLTFAQAFKMVTGNELEAFYGSVQIFLKSRGWA